MVKTGVGPQNFTIRELHDFMCIAALTEDGDFDFRRRSREFLMLCLAGEKKAQLRQEREGHDFQSCHQGSCHLLLVGSVSVTTTCLFV